MERRYPVEMDLRLSRDGVPVVFHDASLDRMAGRAGDIRAMTAAELSQVTLPGDTPVPTLADVLAMIGGRVPLFLELKPEQAGEGRLERAVAAALAGYAGPAAVMSFDPQTMLRFRDLATGRPIGLISCRFDDEEARETLSAHERLALRHLLWLPIVRPHFIACDRAALPATAPALWRLLGGPLLSWTVRSPEQMRTVLQSASQIIFEGFDPDTVVGVRPEG